jgi:hypothetical protein
VRAFFGQLRDARKKAYRQLARALAVSEPTMSETRTRMDEGGDVPRVVRSTGTLRRKQPHTNPSPPLKVPNRVEARAPFLRGCEVRPHHPWKTRARAHWVANALCSR